MEALTVQFIRNYTAEPIGLALDEIAKKNGFSIVTSFGAYDNLGPEIAELASNQNPPSTVILTIDLEYFAGGIFSPNWRLEEAIAELQSLLGAVDALPPKTFVLLST